MSLMTVIFWAVTSGASYQACLNGSCVPATGNQFTFTNLAFDTEYTFSYKVNGVESSPLKYRTPPKQPDPLSDLVARLRKTCGNKCRNVR